MPIDSFITLKIFYGINLQKHALNGDIAVDTQSLVKEEMLKKTTRSGIFLSDSYQSINQVLAIFI